MTKRRKSLGLDEPMRHPDHRRPMTRREFIAQGFLSGAAVVTAPTLFGLLAHTGRANALSADMADMKTTPCGITAGAGKIPFICFDLAGGANIAGSNVLAGGAGGPLDFLTTAGYSKLGLPGDVIPSLGDEFINREFGLTFHSDSAFLRGMQEKTQPGTRGGVNGAVIPARSDNDTGNNPHNPMYAINRAGANGQLLTLIGSRSSMSGGNSMAPADMIDNSVRPTKVDRPSDVTGLVDTGELANQLNPEDAVKVLESTYRLSDASLNSPALDTALSAQQDSDIKEGIRCGYIKSADLVEQFSDPATLDPTQDSNVLSIFSIDEINGDSEFRKTASVMKMVIDGHAGAGTITMGGFDYHTGERATGEARDLRAGRCIGACLEYARLTNKPLMIYIFSDGSVASNGMLDESQGGRGKGVWTGDNSSTAASFFLVYNPTGSPAAPGPNFTGMDGGVQIGHFRSDASVETASSPAANNVNLLVQTVALNYMALHGEAGDFTTAFPGHGLGNQDMRNALRAFEPIVNGTISGS
ncbi:general secretion pathway protein GspF [Ectothiorhodospiraceae bacterium WFHF3C12]|nr:general secretion pathway protein GspF [Ectothiorhodospiraceae bacterium WFHF3C12]